MRRTTSLLLYVRDSTPDGLRELPGVVARPVGHTGLGSLWWRERLLAPAAARDGLDVFLSPAYVCPLALDVPRVTAVHDISFFSIPHEFSLLDGLRRRTLVGASLSASAAVLACSRFTRREISALRPEFAGRVHHVPLGRDDDLPPGPDRPTAREALGVSGPLLLSVGTLLNRRCLPDLFRAVRLLRRRFPLLRLDVVGDNRTWPRLDLERLVETLELSGSVNLLGFVSEAELARRYAAADVAVFLSEYEGFGLPALEAMARDVPVVTSFRPSLGEVFGDAALLVDARDAGGTAAVLEQVLLDASLRDSLRARGRELSARHSWQTTTERTRAVLAQVART